MIVTAAGMRDWKDRQQVFGELDALLQEHCAAGPVGSQRGWVEKFILRHGVSGNVDNWANEWGISRGVTIERFHAQWRDPVTNTYQPWAGPARNKKMAEAEPKADLWLAFWDGTFQQRGGKKVSGTHDGIVAAVAVGLTVTIKPPRVT